MPTIDYDPDGEYYTFVSIPKKRRGDDASESDNGGGVPKSSTLRYCCLVPFGNGAARASASVVHNPGDVATLDLDVLDPSYRFYADNSDGVTVCFSMDGKG
ncbi:hypothetical protein CMI48_03080 [Candidatus Pacearchaeota archaeon]|nr:hypothetical protein [Candidatus Pacearchaeota archaeon]